MERALISVALATERDVVAARQRARQIGALLGFDMQDQTRIATAVSEVARNAVVYARGGRAEFGFTSGGARPHLVIRISDRGPGIGGLAAVMRGDYESRSGMGLGLRGAQRLMDRFEITSTPEGTSVTLAKELPARMEPVTPEMLRRISDQLAVDVSRDPLTELREQNRELMASLEALQQRQEEIAHVNKELADTNRGVVALYNELDERAEQLRRANELKTRFLSNITHEFRTPVNGILALTQLLLDRTDGPLTDEQERQVRYVRQSANSLMELVNDLLDLAKVEAGKAAVRPTHFSVGELFGALRGMMRPLSVRDEVSLVFENPAGISLYQDEAKVSQILRNFISNALKFTERGEVRVFVRPDGEQIVFGVRDTGIGIAPEHRELIFEEFMQVQQPLQARAKGTGLGLPLARKLAELLGGAVSFESKPGEGSTFYLALPRRYGPAPEPEAVAAPAPDAAAGRRVLVIDDDETFRYTVRRSIGGMAEVSEADDGAVGLHKARLERPSAIFLDLRMPGTSGFDVLDNLAEDPATREIPVLIVTSASLSPAERERLSRAAAVLPKDRVSPPAIRDVLRDIFERETADALRRL